jgi:phosphate-selective porin OprO/OprP
MRASHVIALLLGACLSAGDVTAQQTSSQVPPAPKGTSTGADQQGDVSLQENPDQTLENTIDAAEGDDRPRRGFKKWNEYEGPYFTGRWGAGFLIELAGYAQDNISKEQIEMHPDERLRDFRFIMNGRLFPRIKRKITWCAGIMYDGPNHQWLIRQTGVMIAVPELWGHFFIGRQKEGFSLNKVMVGYDGWTMERATINDATIPILADGLKWLGYTPKHGFLWNIGYYNDVFSKDQSFSTYGSQVSGRFAWLPIHSEEEEKLLHLGVNLRWGKPEDNKIRFRSRPEAFPAPYFIDTGSFQSDSTKMFGPEFYFRPARWLIGSEYWWVHVSSKEKQDPVFHGGDFVVTYLITGETRPYNTIGGYFKDIAPNRTVFSGGPGAWELVFRYSHIDLDDKLVRGGEFDRVTPMVNWYLSENVRLEMAYGFGVLERFDLKGNTHFFQTRLQLQF